MHDELRIPEDEIVPLNRVAAGLIGLRILFVNVFGVASPDGSWTLLDAGLPMSAGLIRKWAEDNFAGPPRAIILTHGHFDHAGAVKDLADGWEVPIYAHPLEFPFLNGSAQYPPPDPMAGGGLMAILSPLYPRGPINIAHRLQPLPADGTVQELPGWQWLHTPGHTVGHVSLFRQSDGVLLAGDAFCTVKSESMLAIAQQRPELHGPPAYYTPDWDQARASVERLARLEPAVVAPGHGQPIAGAAVKDQLHQLAANFDALARPRHGSDSEESRSAA